MKGTSFLRGKALVLAATLALGVMGIAGCGSAKSSSSSDDGTIRTELTSAEVAQLMGNGINLGNTMEAYGRSSLGTDAEVTDYETCWGQPVTTQESISGMKAAGFDTIRIPVAWTNMMNFEEGDYTIAKAYLDRVEEIVNYARNEDMYVIINDHWDGGWWGMFGSASEETREAAMELYTSMWTQIAERFKDYSDYVIFESANEELGYRLNDTDIAEDSGTLSDDECYEVANEINQAFVDTVRATGGNNEQRFLLIAGFGTDIVNTVNNSFVMPEDTAESKLLISVHYYDPSGYCINSSISSWGTKDDYDDMNRMLAKMQKFSTQGIGVIIGEYGVLMEDGNRKDGMAEYVANLLDNCDLYGYCPVLWDCNNLYSRTDCKIIYDDMAQLYQERSYAAQADLTQEEIAAAAQADMDEAYANADDGFALDDDTAMAWIMFNSSDWSTIYSVGDVYDPTSSTAGVAASDVEVTGEGTYTVSLDFTGIEGGYANSTVFCALAIANGETLYPGYCIEIDEITINGEPYTLKGAPYTTSDDGLCTRVNLYNGWVSQIPDEARTADGDLTDATPTLLDPEELGEIRQISVTFTYVAGE
jgi:endoglucanase